MMKNNKIKIMVVLMLIVSMCALAACGNNSKNTSKDVSNEKNTYEGNLKITGLDEEFEVPFNEIYSMETVTEKMKNLTSSGELNEVEVTGVKLNDILAKKEISQKDFKNIRLIAGDGYSIDVTSDILTEKDIVLAFKFDGQPLEEKSQPIRAAINDVRSMYWVSNLMEINLQPKSNESSDETSKEASTIKKIVFIEPASNTLQKEDYTYYETVDKAIKAEELLKAFAGTTSDDVHFVAADGFEKSEILDVLKQGYIKITGEYAPLFLSPDLPKGMHVKEILSVSCGDTSFVSAAHSINTYTKREAKKQEGIAIDEVINASNLKGDFYIFKSTDGYSTEISKADLAYGILFEREPGIYQVKFSEELPKSTNVKDVISIEIGNGENVVKSTSN
jgi:hypothetical protein